MDALPQSRVKLQLDKQNRHFVLADERFDVIGFKQSIQANHLRGNRVVQKGAKTVINQ